MPRRNRSRRRPQSRRYVPRKAVVNQARLRTKREERARLLVEGGAA
jgi:hypothetical protein